jgi:mannan endo-1,4-beta-mannosidase
MFLLKVVFYCVFFINSVFAAEFIEVKNGKFYQGDKPYYFMGANFWQAMNLAIKNKNQLTKELNLLKKHGVKNLRITALTEGPSQSPYRVEPALQNQIGVLNEELLVGLDIVLDEMDKRNMHAVLVLGNFWPWSGGMAQWVNWFDSSSSIPYPPPHPNGSWSTFQSYSARFYSMDKAVEAYHNSIIKLLTRINTINKKYYNQDPTIMAWQLANEPRGDKNRIAFLKWIESTAALIKKSAPRQLVSLGSEGETMDASNAGNDFLQDHQFKNIDYTTIHIWAENWGVYNPFDANATMLAAKNLVTSYIAKHLALSKMLGKPMVLEEFGIARDQRSMDPMSKTTQRNEYYGFVFQEVLRHMEAGENLVGVNFWAWSGFGQPKQPHGGLWVAGDDLLGDPPHEEQGWYGVYAHDIETLNIIRDYAHKYKQKR